MHVEELSLIAVGGLALVVAVAILAGRIGVGAPLILLVVGIGIGYIPGVPLLQVDPSVILMGVLPPLLYGAAVNVPLLDLRRNLGPISALSVVLVIVSAIAIGLLLNGLVPAIPLAAAIALGAVVAPTDAVAATAIGKRVGMPPRLITILEGESLVNDATSLVLLRTAVAATAGGFAFWPAAGQFSFAVVVALAIGLVIGAVTVWVRSHLTNPVYDTVISFTVPFIAFVPTEYVGASGVLAVVVTGLYSGHFAPKKFTATARFNERLNWRTALFVLENGVFLLMGIELHALMADVAKSPLQINHVLLISLTVVAALIVLRLSFMALVTWRLARALPHYEARAKGMKRIATRVQARPTPQPPTDTQALKLKRVEHLVRRTEADARHARDQGLDWHGATILGWSGMRGVVTLAAAQSIPTTVPFRSQLVLIAFFVAVTTLLLHGLTLSGLIRRLRPNGPSANERGAELLSLYDDLITSGETALRASIDRDREAARKDPEHLTLSEGVVNHARSSMVHSMAPLALALPEYEEVQASKAEIDARASMRIALAIIEAQRATLLEERAIGQYSSDVLRTAEEVLDAYEQRLTPPAQH